MTDQEKREPTITDVPPLAPSRDEVDMRRQTAERRKFVRRKLDAENETAAQSRGWLLPSIFIMVLLAVVIGLARWNYVLQIQADANQQMLNLARDRITVVERRLSTTDESMSKSGVVMQVQIKELKDKTDKLWEQMDKLWASAWRRNQKELEDQSNRLKKQVGRIDGQKKLIKATQDKVVENQKALARIKEQLQGIGDVATTLNAMEKRLAEGQKRQQGAIDTLNSVSAKQNKLTDRIRTNEEWVESINGYRKQLNASLEQLERDINQLQIQMQSVAPAASNPAGEGMAPVAELP